MKNFICSWRLSLQSLFNWLFPSVGDVTSVLEMEGQCPGAKVGLSRIEASCRHIHILPWAFKGILLWAWRGDGVAKVLPGLVCPDTVSLEFPLPAESNLEFCCCSLVPNDKDSLYSFPSAPSLLHTLPPPPHRGGAALGSVLPYSVHDLQGCLGICQ